MAHFESRGHRVVVAAEARGAWRYFAGTDDERLAGFHRLLADPAIDVMIAARGGYGLSRVLHRIDWEQVRASGKAFVGFSDFTAFNLAALARSGLVTFHGPMLSGDFGEGIPDAFMEPLFRDLLAGRDCAIEDLACDAARGASCIDGTLWGGNLSLLTHLVGTPFFPRIEGGILYVEEIGEEPYAIERMFLQLWHAGVLGAQAALLLGDFRDCSPVNTARYPYSLDEVVDTLRAFLPFPVLTGLPFGHVARKATLPFGAPATLLVQPGRYSLRVPGCWAT